MTTKEFDSEYNKLVKVYPQQFGNEVKRHAIASYVKDLDARWWCSLVNRMILSSNPRLDIEDAARGQRLATKRIEETNALFDMSKKLESKISENGLNSALEKLGANSLIDAIFKKKTAE